MIKNKSNNLTKNVTYLSATKGRKIIKCLEEKAKMKKK